MSNNRRPSGDTDDDEIDPFADEEDPFAEQEADPFADEEPTDAVKVEKEEDPFAMKRSLPRSRPFCRCERSVEYYKRRNPPAEGDDDADPFGDEEADPFAAEPSLPK